MASEPVPLASFPVHAVAQGANGTALVFHRSKTLLDKVRSRLLGVNPVTATVGTAATLMLREDAKRYSWGFVNLSATPMFLFFDGEVSTTRGIFVAANGGQVLCEGDSLQVFGPASARAYYYDRNPVERASLGQFTPGAASEGSTTTGSRTVPAGSKGYLQFAGTWVENGGTAALNGAAEISITITTAGGASSRANFARLPTGAAAAAFNHPGFTGGLGLLPAAANVSVVRQSGNTAAGSSVTYEGVYHMVEFDA